ncbi:hypothetical protein IA539_15385 [Gordonia sp. zg691]|uniref:DUF6319 family protein n=1 Tax=Gordonia jinghuaiqii TaxID=2758710 RepID=UPI0016625504|nr:DUF6319 family protein [Gordonia jinghuaiqii]MBD0862586.1 hypothetical protein [Gordonia jinghuaiqii]
MVCVNARKPTGLTPADLESLSAGLAAGKRVTVYLRDPMPSLDLDAGASARVVSIDGTTVTVSPKGIDDQLPFEPDELQKSRPTTTSATPARQRVTRTSEAADTPGPARSASTAPKPAGPAPAGSKATPPEPKAAPEKPVPAKAARRTKAPVAAVSVTVTSTGESTWTVSVAHGTKKHGKPTEVTADRVAKAMRDLGDEAAITAVDGVIESARAAAQKRIEELSHELEAARAALAHLDGPDANS